MAVKRSPYYNWITPAQLRAYRELKERWRKISPLGSYRLAPPSALQHGHYLGVWCGEPFNGRPGSIFIGIEADGYAQKRAANARSTTT